MWYIFTYEGKTKYSSDPVLRNAAELVNIKSMCITIQWFNASIKASAFHEPWFLTFMRKSVLKHTVISDHSRAYVDMS